jgi:mxaA protein
LRSAVLQLHRAFDAAGGKILLRADLDEFFRRRPEFARLQPNTERFFKASERIFFGPDEGVDLANFDMTELVGFAKELAESERAR